MKFYKKSALDSENIRILEDYDSYIQQRISENYNYPTRMRDWELSQILLRFDKSQRYECLLDTGCFNTFLPVWLSQYASNVTASDLLYRLLYKNILRRAGLLKKKAHGSAI